MTKKRSGLESRKEARLSSTYHSPQVDVDIRLNTNESPYSAPLGFIEDVKKAIEDASLNRYPDRNAVDLRQAIADYHSCNVNNVFCANGSNEVIQTLLFSFVSSGDEVVVFEPTYALHSHISKIAGASLIVGERNANFQVDEDEIVKILDRSEPKIIFFCSPNNPTGNLESYEVVKRTLEMFSGIVVVDEAYVQFAEFNFVELLKEYDNLVIIRTFSKTWGLAGLRLGYGLSSSSIAAELFNTVLPYHLNSLTQRIGIAALNYEQEMLERVALMKEDRGNLINGLENMGVEVFPSESNFILFRPNMSPKIVWESLVKKSILIRDCSSWPRLEGCLRVSVGTRLENEVFLTSLAEIIDESK